MIETMIQAVVFDLDGVLVDSEPVWEEVRRGLVAERGGRWAPDAQRRLMGMSTPEWARYLSEDLGVGLPPDQVAAEVIDRMVARYTGHVPLMDAAVDTVRTFAARWPLGLASSSPPRLIEAVLQSAGLRSSFRAVMSTEQVPHGKPAPDIYLAVTGALGCPPPPARRSRTPRTGSARRPPRGCGSSPSRSPATRPTPTPWPGPAWCCPVWLT